MPDHPPRPTDAELEILTVLWSLGPATVRMAEKGLVRRNEEQRAHVYEAARPQAWTQKQLAGDLLQRAFGGSARSLMMGALSARKASKNELDEMRRLLDDYEKGNR
jgi:predicted transcriptional regulator